jgi:hypothetical protein
VGETIPGTYFLTVVASVDAVADGAPEFEGNASAPFDRQIRDAASRIENVGSRDRTRGACREALHAKPAGVLFRGGGRVGRRSEQDHPEEAPRPRPRMIKFVCLPMKPSPPRAAATFSFSGLASTKGRVSTPGKSARIASAIPVEATHHHVVVVGRDVAGEVADRRVAGGGRGVAVFDRDDQSGSEVREFGGRIGADGGVVVEIVHRAAVTLAKPKGERRVGQGVEGKPRRYRIPRRGRGRRGRRSRGGGPRKHPTRRAAPRWGRGRAGW